MEEKDNGIMILKTDEDKTGFTIKNKEIESKAYRRDYRNENRIEILNADRSEFSQERLKRFSQSIAKDVFTLLSNKTMKETIQKQIEKNKAYDTSLQEGNALIKNMYSLSWKIAGLAYRNKLYDPTQFKKDEVRKALMLVALVGANEMMKGENRV